jgi:hypothetical protein
MSASVPELPHSIPPKPGFLGLAHVPVMIGDLWLGMQQDPCRQRIAN